MVARRTTKKNHMPKCDHMRDVHCINLTTIQVLSLISAATHAVRAGYDDAPDILEDGVNALLDQARIDCEFEDDTMILTYNP